MRPQPCGGRAPDQSISPSPLGSSASRPYFEMSRVDDPLRKPGVGVTNLDLSVDDYSSSTLSKWTAAQGREVARQ